MPMLGVCLGHQAIGQAFGGQVVRAKEPMHGKTSQVHHDDTDVFAGLPNPFTATRYHSLIVPQATLPECWCRPPSPRMASSWACAMRSIRSFGVQFHPESIATSHGHEILKNFLDIARGRNAPPQAA